MTKYKVPREVYSNHWLPLSEHSTSAKGKMKRTSSFVSEGSGESAASSDTESSDSDVVILDKLPVGSSTSFICVV